MSTTLPPLSSDDALTERDILTSPITDASAWVASDYADERSYVTPLGPAEVDDLRRAVEEVTKAGRLAESLRRPEDFPLPVLGPRLESLRVELEDGRGFALLRNVPVEDYGDVERRALLMGVAVHLGAPVHQDVKGTLVEEVTDRGLSYSNITVRGYMTRAELTPHCDSGDVVCLLCIHPAKSGGLNQITSAMSIYNVLLREHPELLELLYRGFRHNIRGNGPVGEWENVTRHRVPVYSYYKGRLSCRYNLKSMLTAEEWPGVEPLSADEREAIEKVAELAMRPDLRLDMDLRAGDLQMVNNHMVLHTRTAYEDHPEPERKRFLIRVWVDLPNGRELDERFADHFNTGPRQPPAIKLA